MSGAGEPAAPPPDAAPERVSIAVSGDRVAAEALALEIRRLARRHGLEIGSVRVERGDPDSQLPPESDPA